MEGQTPGATTPSASVSPTNTIMILPPDTWDTDGQQGLLGRPVMLLRHGWGKTRQRQLQFEDLIQQVSTGPGRGLRRNLAPAHPASCA